MGLARDEVNPPADTPVASPPVAEAGRYLLATLIYAAVAVEADGGWFSLATR